MLLGSRAASAIAFIAMAVILFVSTVAIGQTRSQQKRISGIVTDPSGAVIVGASVQLKDAAGQSCGTAKTNSAGRFSVAPCGDRMFLSVTHPGFEAFQKEIPVPNADLQITMPIAAAAVGINVN